MSTPEPTPAPPPQRHLLRLAILIAVALVVLAAGLLFAAWQPLRSARDDYRAGRVARAIDTANKWSRLHLWPAQYHQLLAAAYLTGGKPEAAQPHLDALRGSRLWCSAIDRAEVARRMFARERFREFLAYDSAFSERGESPDVDLYRAAAYTLSGDPGRAARILYAVDRSRVDTHKLAAVESATTQRKAGSYPLVLDRNGRTIAAFQLANHDLVAVDAQFSPLVEKEAGSLTLESQLANFGVDTTTVTTLDPDVQRAALAALGGFRGALVAIDPRTNEILAIASNRGNGPLANLAIEQQYEPGSVVKLLTGMNAIGGVDLKTLFPYHCTGDLVIDGRHFADWLPAGHGDLPSIDEALAVSCNIVFADLGLRLGSDKLQMFMKRAGFDGKTSLGAYDVPLGKIVPPILNRYETANLAIGLQHETVNALHLAMIGSMMANRGRLTAPRLVRERRSILGETVGTIPAQGSEQLANADAAAQMVRAMTAVVTSANGTGHRAAIEGLTIAMKTGTSGSRADGGLESVIVAFAPVDKPRIAFGMIAQDAGPAEYAGAKIAHDFLEATKGRP